jgi:hypothetical protein
MKLALRLIIAVGLIAAWVAVSHWYPGVLTISMTPGDLLILTILALLPLLLPRMFRDAVTFYVWMGDRLSRSTDKLREHRIAQLEASVADLQCQISDPTLYITQSLAHLSNQIARQIFGATAFVIGTCGFFGFALTAVISGNRSALHFAAVFSGAFFVVGSIMFFSGTNQRDMVRNRRNPTALLKQLTERIERLKTR